MLGSITSSGKCQWHGGRQCDRANYQSRGEFYQMGQLVERAVSTPTQEFTPNRPPHHHSDWSPTRIYMHFHLPPITLTINLTFQVFLHCGDRGILVWQKFDILNLACCQIVPICSLISELFLFLLQDLSFPCRYFLSTLMGILMGKWQKFIFWQ